MGDGADDWYMHASPATTSRWPRSRTAVRTGALKTRDNSAGNWRPGGQWTNLGPDNAVYPLNPFRNRYVYVPNEYVAAGAPRTA